ncbi:MAG: hypothetical protein HUJ59_03015 [Bacilli bacterium]|nr:hypothetical protein [Bacilli bacterium]
MSQASKGKLNYRCPSCFQRDIDMDMFYDEEKHEYYCLRCGFRGTEEEVLKLNEQAKYRYKAMKKRVKSFGEDNEPLVMEDHKAGEQ